jgi:hypothetical protein
MIREDYNTLSLAKRLKAATKAIHVAHEKNYQARHTRRLRSLRLDVEAFVKRGQAFIAKIDQEIAKKSITPTTQEQPS